MFAGPLLQETFEPFGFRKETMTPAYGLAEHVVRGLGHAPATKCIDEANCPALPPLNVVLLLAQALHVAEHRRSCVATAVTQTGRLWELLQHCLSCHHVLHEAARLLGPHCVL